MLLSCPAAGSNSGTAPHFSHLHPPPQVPRGSCTHEARRVRPKAGARVGKHPVALLPNLAHMVSNSQMAVRAISRHLARGREPAPCGARSFRPVPGPRRRAAPPPPPRGPPLGSQSRARTQQPVRLSPCAMRDMTWAATSLLAARPAALARLGPGHLLVARSCLNADGSRYAPPGDSGAPLPAGGLHGAVLAEGTEQAEGDDESGDNGSKGDRKSVV